MSDQLESMLGTLDTRRVASEPAPAFLRAVARRRYRRRLARAASALAVPFAAWGFWLLAHGPTPAPPGKEIARRGPTEPAVVQVSSLGALTRANVGRADSDLDLPEASGSGEPTPVRLGWRLDSARLEHWLSH